MFSKNIAAFFQNMVKNGAVKINMDDEIIRDTMITRDGDIVSPRIKELLGAPRAGA
jgi:NAD(P) transhydrogenase subunit alpha